MAGGLLAPLRARVARAGVAELVVGAQQRRRHCHVRHVRGGDLNRMHEARPRVDARVRLVSEVPVVALLRLVGLRVARAPPAPRRGGGPGEGGVDDGPPCMMMPRPPGTGTGSASIPSPSPPRAGGGTRGGSSRPAPARASCRCRRSAAWPPSPGRRPRTPRRRGGTRPAGGTSRACARSRRASCRASRPGSGTRRARPTPPGARSPPSAPGTSRASCAASGRMPRGPRSSPDAA